MSNNTENLFLLPFDSSDFWKHSIFDYFQQSLIVFCFFLFFFLFFLHFFNWYWFKLFYSYIAYIRPIDTLFPKNIGDTLLLPLARFVQLIMHVEEMVYSNFALVSKLEGLVQYCLTTWKKFHHNEYSRRDGTVESLFTFNWLNKFTSVNI